MNKKIAIIFLIFNLIFCSVSSFAVEKPVTVYIDGVMVQSDVSPIIVSDRVMLPIRSVTEHLDGRVLWNEETRCVTIMKDDNLINLFIGNNVAFVNNERVELDVPALIIKDRTMVPVRFVSESFNMDVEWEGETKTVYITHKEEENKDKMVTLDSVEIREGETFVEVKIEGVGDLKHSMIKLDNPKRYVYDIEGCVLNTKGINSITFNGKYVKSVRWSQYEEDVCRVVIDLEKFYFYDYSVKGNDVYIVMDNLTPPADKPSDDKTETIKFTELNEKAKNKLVIIDPGHGGSEVGTIGDYNGEDIYEKDINIKICLILEKMLKECGVSYYMIRDDDSYVSITQRPVIANELEAYFYLCIHNNASENKETNGVQVYYSDSTPTFEGITNKDISKIYYENIASLGLKKSGIVDSNKYIVINKTNMPAIILENAFVSNEEDLEKLMDDEFLFRLAEQICQSTIVALNKTVE